MGAGWGPDGFPDGFPDRGGDVRGGGIPVQVHPSARAGEGRIGQVGVVSSRAEARRMPHLCGLKTP